MQQPCSDTGIWAGQHARCAQYSCTHPQQQHKKYPTDRLVRYLVPYDTVSRSQTYFAVLGDASFPGPPGLVCSHSTFSPVVRTVLTVANPTNIRSSMPRACPSLSHHCDFPFDSNSPSPRHSYHHITIQDVYSACLCRILDLLRDSSKHQTLRPAQEQSQPRLVPHAHSHSLRPPLPRIRIR